LDHNITSAGFLLRDDPNGMDKSLMGRHGVYVLQLRVCGKHIVLACVAATCCRWMIDPSYPSIWVGSN